MPTKKIERINFGKIEEVIKPPNLIEIQVDSYREFLQIENQEGETIDPRRQKRRRIGLQAVFEEIFPVKSYDEKCELDFLFYEIGKPKVSWLECLREGLTFGASLHVKFRLKDEQGAKEEKVFMGEIPLMTPQGTFIVNGAERVIVSQLHRSPGLAFETTQHANGKTLHSFRIIPDRGSWYEAQFDTNDMLWVYLDRKKRRRKFLATTFFRALGYGSDAEILKLFYEVEESPIKKLAKLDDVEIQNRVPTKDVMDWENGGKMAHAFEPLSKEKVKKIAATAKSVQKIQVVNISFDGGIIIKCLKKDPTKNEEEALKDIYRRLRPGDPPTIANARAMIHRLFFDSKRYDLGLVGRYKINQKLGLTHWSEEGVEELGITDSNARFLKEREVKTVGSLARMQKEDLWKDWGLDENPGKETEKIENKLQKVGEERKDLDEKLKIQDYLREANVKTVGDLVEKTEKQLQNCRGYTEELFQAIEDRLENYGKKQGVKLRIGMPSFAQQKKMLNANVDELEFSERIQECLKRAKISTVKDLVEKKLVDLQGQNAPKRTKRKPTIEDLYDLFGLDEKATPEQLKKSYRTKIKEFAPDKYQGGQAAKELQAKAEEWSKRINEANDILKEYQQTKDNPKQLDGKGPDYWDGKKYWGESGNQTLDAEDVKEIERKLEEFGRKNNVELHLGMSPSELAQLEQDLKQQEEALDRLERALKKKIDEIFLITYLMADQEEKYVVAQANTSIKENGELERAMCRRKGDFLDVDPQEGFKDSVHYMDVSPKQLVSVAAGLIPFLEHDDANRALMGSNMQRQAVPLLVTEAPFVGTGLEKLAAQDSRSVVVANDLKEGVEYKVASVNLRLPNRKRREKEDNSRYIVITKDGKLPERRRLKCDPKNGIYLYQLRKFMRSNAATCINQKSLVTKGQVVKKGDVIADGPCTDNGELALGRNVLCAFMPWNGYNFEDAVLISRRIVKDDVFTSIHIDEFEVNARDTKLGPEEITRDIPNLGEEVLKDLGADGIIREGAEVKPGDILVGKVTPKSETELAPEEKLLRAIFGEKAADVKDTSLRVPSGTYGIVMEVRDVKKENERSSRSESESKKQAKQIREDYEKKRKELRDQLTEKLSGILLGEKIPLEVCNSETAEIIIPANKKITKTLLKKLANNYNRLLMPPSPIRNKILEIIEPFKPKFEDLKNKRDEALDREESGVEEEETGVVKSVKVFIASKRKLSVGDKMAGRHGNKGVVAQIVPEEDMPFLANGTPVDIVLNPLGVPSRMNVGQVLETHLGWAAKILGVSFATPIFDGIKEKGEEKENEEKKSLHNLLKKWKDESLSVASSQKELERLREKLRKYGVRDYLKAADGLVQEEDGVAWDFGMASSSSNGSSDGKKKKRGCSLVKEDGKAVLYDGRTGERFNQEVVVGYIYMLKLGHLVADKIHARAVGPYSLVTQQPLGGKAQYGGQRFGEMEVWAMEAYGAAHALQELITVKSDDVQGRTDIYASVVNGDNSLNASVPESFNVLVKEIQSLGMDVQVGYVRGRERLSLPSLAASPALDLEPEEPHRVL